MQNNDSGKAGQEKENWSLEKVYGNHTSIIVWKKKFKTSQILQSLVAFPEKWEKGHTYIIKCQLIPLFIIILYSNSHGY